MKKKIINFFVKGAKTGTLAIAIGILISALFTSETELASEYASFLGGAVAGLVGLISAFLITEQNKYIEDDKNKKDVLEQIKYIILNIDEDFKYIDNCIGSEQKVNGFMKYDLNKEEIAVFEKYKTSYNNQGLLKLSNYIYDKAWGEKLSSITDFNDKRVLLDFMRKIELYLTHEDYTKYGVEVFTLYKDIVDVIEVIIKYRIYDESFESFGYKNTSWRIEKLSIRHIKNKIKSIYNRFNLEELECREWSIRLDKEMIKFAKEQLDIREKELDIREKELKK